MSSSSNSSNDSILFFAIGDWGRENSRVKKTASSMAHFARQYEKKGVKLSFIASLGDHCYPDGFEDVNDPNWRSIWQDQFIIPHKILQTVPWYCCLGNHDYMIDKGMPQLQFAEKSQLQYAHLWRLPDKCYSVEFELAKSKYSRKKEATHLKLFAFDTNGVQKTVQLVCPEMKQELIDQHLPWLKNEFESTDKEEKQTDKSYWRILMAHHPTRTCGLYHGKLGDKLASAPFRLERVLEKGKVDVYITGHEHVAQTFSQKSTTHVVCGNSGGEYHGFFGGPVLERFDRADFVDDTNGKVFGFCIFLVSNKTIRIEFVDASTNKIFHSITKTKN